MFLSVDEALTQVDMQKPAMIRGLKAGEIKGFQGPDGEWLVDAASVLTERFPLLKGHEQPTLNVVVQQVQGPGKIEALEALLHQERGRVSDLQAERDRWASYAERLTALVEAMTPYRSTQPQQS